MPKTITAMFLLFGASALADAPSDPDAGTYYTYGQLGVKKLVVDGARIDITFDPIQEQFHWCPGIKVKETKKATVVTFVRCKTSNSCDVDRKAKIGRKLIRTVSIDIRGKDVYVRNGPAKYKRIHDMNSKSPAPGASSSANANVNGWLRNEFSRSGS